MILEKSVIEHLNDGAILLCPNRRLASFCQEAYDRHQALNQSAWETPKIYSISDWCTAFWVKAQTLVWGDHHLISGLDSVLLLEDLIKASPYAATLLKPHTTAKGIYKAWSTLHAWRQGDHLNHPWGEVDLEVCQQFCLAYQQKLNDLHCIDEAQLLDKISLVFQNQSKAISALYQTSVLIGFGFDELTPQLQAFLDNLKALSWEIIFSDTQKPLAEKRVVCVCQDLKAEIQQAAHWAKEKLNQGAAEKQIPKIGIIVPNLPQCRQEIINTFERMFAPDNHLSPKGQINPYFNLSSGIPLAQYPVIVSALSVFQLCQTRLPLEVLMHLLNTPYIQGGIKHFGMHQHLKAKLRAAFKNYFTLEQLITLIETHLPEFQNGVSNLKEMNTLKIAHKKQNFSEWADVFNQVLTIWGWPGERVLDSVEHQAVKRFYTLLEDFKRFDALFPPVSLYEALDKLKKQAANIAFQPENRQAPIQVLGLLEASGLWFDHVWVLNLHQENWPPPADPNPFLPLDLQREHQMPHATAARESAFARKMMHRLERSAKAVTFSYPRIHENNPVGPSALLSHLTVESSAQPLQEEPLLPVLTASTFSLEFYDDLKPYPLMNTIKQKGGSQIFLYQAQCPFKAFASFRLKAQPLERQTFGLSPQLRGILLHEVMQKFWEEVKTQQRLLELGEGAEALMATLLEQVIHQARKPFDYPDTFWEVEKERNFNILKDTLVYERQRPAFKVIQVEHFQEVTVGVLSVNIRIDRMDECQNNQIIVMDYKTNEMNLNDIISMPLKNPQLPLYLEGSEGVNPQAVAWFVLTPTQTQLTGVSDSELGLEGIKRIDEISKELSWETQKHTWSEALLKLSEAFVEGQTTLLPMMGAQTCRYCDLQSLCRIQDQREINRYG